MSLLDLPKHYMLVDVSNLLHRTFYVHAKESFEDLVGLAYKSTFITLNKYFKDLQPDAVVLAFDDRYNWRKKYTASPKCASKKAYKGNRRLNMTEDQKTRYDMFLKFVDDFETLLKQHTSIVCLKGDELEADDIISAFVQKYAFEEHNRVTIISQDRDLYQLLKTENVEVVDPASKETITCRDVDADFMLFEKFFRGDPTDNVQNAYPGIHKKTIQKAYDDPYERTNILKNEWTDIHENTFKVETLFNENKLLMDLTQQPDHIRDRMRGIVEHAFENRSKYSHFHFLRFVGNYKLKEVSKKVDHLIPMLSR